MLNHVSRTVMSEGWDPVEIIPRRGHLFYWEKEAFYHWIPAFAGMTPGVEMTYYPLT
jgi:hypothetical protein